eukprot:TRINITY_DN19727_c0_g1_i2.p1 TRINITY_DN19727_c0_g1~~TRINITY_DN19727_c0_g1_i2.p1  ORF type:complete len:903 (-),score=185.46 TRINITY_DN19727_c0_g1_i2:68-2731(-)
MPSARLLGPGLDAGTCTGRTVTPRGSICSTVAGISPQLSLSTDAGQSDGLESCKQAAALLVGDIRAEVQQAVASLRSEASNLADGRLNKTRQGQLAGKMVNLAENLHQAEKDVLAKLRDLLNHSDWDHSDYVAKQLQTNNQISQRVNSSWERVFELVTRLDMKMVNLESCMTISEERISKQVSDIEAKVKNVEKSVRSEIERATENSTEQFVELKDALENEHTRTRTSLTEQIKDLESKVKEATQSFHDSIQQSDGKILDVLEANYSLESASMKVAADISKLQSQDDRGFAELDMKMHNMRSEQSVQLCELKHDVGMLLRPVANHITKMRREATNETKVMLKEIGKLQKALHVDYVAVSYGTGKADIRSGVDALANLAKESDDDLLLESDEDEDLSHAKRYRDMFVQTETTVLKDSSSMTDPVKFADETKKARTDAARLESKKRKDRARQEAANGKNKDNAFGGADKLKEQAAAAAMKKQYNVFDFYWDEGWAQRLARSSRFDNLTLCLVMANSLWIAVDLDLNDADLIVDAHPTFIIAENFFCMYFTSEVVIRLCAFKAKRKAFGDAWFVFDFFLVSLMVMETWVLTFVLLISGSHFTMPGGTTVFRMIRLVRLLRLTRLTKLLRAIPELAIIMKGLAFAARSVAIFFVLWMVIIYVFSILFGQFLRGSSAGTKYFSTVPEGMNTLFLHGVLSGQAEMINEITSGQPWLWPIVIFLMMLVAVTIMYMLLGVLVDVIGAVASSEKQKIEVSYIVGRLREELKVMGLQDDMSITQLEFHSLIMEPRIVKVMTEAGVDVVVLADMLEMVFEDIFNRGKQSMTFVDLVNIVLNMRGANPATVKDCKEQVRVTKAIIKAGMTELTEEMNEQFRQLRQDMSTLDLGYLDAED